MPNIRAKSTKMFISHQIFAAVLLLALTSWSPVRCIAVPKLNQESEWFLIESEQTTTISPETHFKSSTWQVSDYFSFKAKVAFSVHKNSETDEAYELITLGGHHYYITNINNADPTADQEDCRLDNRHDHSTLFPWRYSATNSNSFDLTKSADARAPFHLIGVGALWMNLAADKGADCRVVDHGGVARARLNCKSGKKLQSTYYELEFKWPEELPRRAQVTRLKSVSHDQWTILEEVTQTIDIKAFEQFEGEIPMPMMRHRIDQVSALCRKLHESSGDILFPSLMRFLANSDQRNYHIAYTLKLYDDPEKATKLQLLERQTIQEWFSFRYEMQTFIRNRRQITSGGGEKEAGNEKLMRLFNVVDGSSVNYRIQLIDNQPASCEFASLDQDQTLAGMSRLMLRPISLASHKFVNSTKSHQGELIGLGALLMNLADIKHKRQMLASSLEGSEIRVSNQAYTPFIVWIVEDFRDSNQRFYIFFKKSSTLKRNFESGVSQIGDLARIELRRRLRIASDTNKEQPSLGGLGDDERLDEDRWRYALIMEIDIIDFATSLYQYELENVFRLPPNCPPASESVEIEIEGLNGTGTGDLPSQELEEDSWTEQELPPPDNSFSFPMADDWHASMEENYKITSTWSLVSSGKSFGPPNLSFKVVEYLMIDQSDWGNLHSRLDLIHSDGETRYLLDYTNDEIFKIEDGHCRLVDEPDKWLQVFSSSMNLAGYHQMDAKKPLRHLGIGGLWSLASRSAYVDLVAVNPNDDNKRDGLFRTMWALRDDPELVDNTRVYFRFIMRPDNDPKPTNRSQETKSKLDMVMVDSDGFWQTLGQGVQSVHISNIQIEPDKAQLEDFSLPPSYKELVIEVKQRKFPLLVEEVKSQQGPKVEMPPSDVNQMDFEITYDLHWGTDLRTVEMQVTETHLAGKPRVCSLDLVSDQQSQVHLEFWSSPNEAKKKTMLEYQPVDRQRLWKKAPNLEELLEIDEFLSLLDQNFNKEDPTGRHFAGLPLADLWTMFAAFLEKNRDQVHVKTTIGKFHNLETHEHTIWSLDNQLGELQFETRLGFDQVERLSSIFVKKHTPDEDGQRVFMNFKVKQVGQVSELERKTLAMNSSAFEQQEQEGQPAPEEFPNLYRLMGLGQRLYMRSEIVTFGKVSSGGKTSTLEPLESYFLDEWLTFGQAYRSRYSTGALRGEPRRHFDQLIYPPTREYFDLSKQHSCPMEPANLDGTKTTRDMRLSLNGFVGESLFYSANKIGFYGPVSLWLLANDFRLERLFNGANLNSPPDLDYKLHIYDLFDESRLTDWLLTDRWSVTHETFGQFTMVFQQALGDSGVHGIQLEKIQTGEDGSSSKLVVETVDCRFVFDSSNFEEFDANLRIPPGFGCARSQEASHQSDFLPRDYLVFDGQNPREFYYEASLMVAPNNGSQHLEMQRVINTGSFMRYPEHWSKMSLGTLWVNRQELHHLDGRMRAFTRVTAREPPDSMRGTTRLVDELTGLCRIVLNKMTGSPSDDRIIVLSFNDEVIELTLSMLISYMGTTNTGSQMIQEFESSLEEVDKVTTIVYETKLDNLRLNDRLQGPGSLVKTFKREKTTVKQFRDAYHTGAKLELIVYGKAHLTLKLSRLSSITCGDIIRAAKAEECFEDSESGLALNGANQASAVGHLASSHLRHRRRRSFEMKFEARCAFCDHHQFSLQDFELNKKYLERDFQILFLVPPDPVPVLQLGNYWLQFQPTDATIRARFNLLEPAALIHVFDQLFGHKIDVNSAGLLRAFGIELETKLVSSKFSCSDFCEAQSHRCLAFSHCSDRTCSYLQTSRWSTLSETNPDDDVEAFLDKHLIANPNCSLYYWPSFKSHKRLYIDEIVQMAQDQLAGPDESSKFSLSTRIFEPKFNLDRPPLVKLVAVELRELSNSIEDDTEVDIDDNKLGQLSMDFVLLRDKSDLQLAGLTDVKTKLLEARNLVECLAACESIQCQLASYCASSRVCSLVANLNNWGQFEAIAQDESRIKEDKDCAIYSWDFTRDYEHFDGTNEPSSYIWKDSAMSLVECAAKCELTSLEASHRASAQDCLSFDYCFGVSPDQPTACFGQKTHVILDNFDQQLLEANTADLSHVHAAQGTITKAPVCAHYSKSILADFAVIKGKKFADHNSIIFHNFPLDKCALVCRRDETCLSFEYCSKPTKSHNTCYIQRLAQRELDESMDQPQDEIGAKEAEMLDMTECNIYKFKSDTLEEFDDELTKTSETLAEHHLPKINENGRERWRLPVTLLCLLALTLGSLVGFIRRELNRRRTTAATYRE